MPTCTRCGFASDRAFRFCPECGTEDVSATPTREQRRVVTVLFCDLAGSTALGESLDPERLRALLARYFERMQGIVERHGGTVEKFIGDAVMAVFGVPTVHEDDALRAVRAAFEMRDALPALDLQGRIGVMTGEVVTGTDERLVTGDPVNVAARLEGAASPGEVLLGEPTLALVRDAVEVQPIEPLVLKGKRDPVPAFRLLAVHDAPERDHRRAIVGREREITLVTEAWRRAVTERRCELVTIVGDAGVGKSRLVRELRDVADAMPTYGRCLPYGEGATYWPVVEVLKQLALMPPDEAAAASIRALLAESDDPTTADDIAWAFRKTLEHAARERPLLVVFDDIQWGEETFLDLIEHVALLSTGAALLLVCVARPELMERRPTWPVTLRLEALGDAAVDELIPQTIEPGLRSRIIRAAGGNPLFVLEMLAMASNADGDVSVPPTLQALLAARLDQIEPAEREVLERGAVEGEVFHRGAVQALATDATPVMPRLATLVRKQLIRPDTAVVTGEDGFRFRHSLIRDAAYDSLPKAVRAALHERFAAWLEQHAVDLVELDEIAGYHLEQSCRYRLELGTSDGHTAALAAHAHRRLAAAGSRALARLDYTAAVRLLERAAELVPASERTGRFDTELTWARFQVGRGSDRVLGGLDEAIAGAIEAGDRPRELGHRFDRAAYMLVFDPNTGMSHEIREFAAKALPALEASGDDWALSLAFGALALAEQDDFGSWGDVVDAAERALAHASRAGDRTMAGFARSMIGSAQAQGAVPVDECLRWLDEHESADATNASPTRVALLAMLGRFDEAHQILSHETAWAAERGAIRPLMVLAVSRYTVAMLEGRYDDAEAAGREAWAALTESGDLSNHECLCCYVAKALVELGRDGEALEWLDRGATSPSSESEARILAAQVRGRALSSRDLHGDAIALSRSAVALADASDMLNAQGSAYSDLGTVLARAGSLDEAAIALAHAVERYERKGNLVLAQRLSERLAALTGSGRAS